jgi:hypothetical protein
MNTKDGYKIIYLRFHLNILLIKIMLIYLKLKIIKNLIYLLM